MNKTTIFIILGILILVGGFIGYRYIGNNGEVPYEFVTVHKGSIKQIVFADGFVVADSKIKSKFQTSGKIASINYEVGQEVERGNILAGLESRDQEIKVKQRQASLAQAHANLDLKLAGVSPEDIQVYEIAVTNAEISLENAQQNLKDIETDAEEDLNNAYENALNTLDNSYLKLYNAFNTIDLVQRTYFNSNDQESIRVKENKQRIKNAMNLVKSFLDIAKDDSKNENIDIALSEMKKALDTTYNTLAIVREACEKAIYRNTISATDKASLDTQKSNTNTAHTSITNAQQTISTTKITNETNINVAKAEVSIAEVQLQKAKDELTLLKAGPREVDIANLEAKILEAEASLELVQEELRKTKLIAPCGGIITEVNGEVGENINTTNIFIITISSEVQIEANVPEIDVVKVKVGNPIEIILDAFGDRIFSGKIASLEPAETVIQGVVYYQIKVVFDKDSIDANIRPSMTADLNILTAQKDDILVLLKEAVKQKDSKEYVQILENGEKNKLVDSEIETGLEGVENVEIIKGLKQGDQVVSFIKETE
jgi:RND family efflux transporter MFP subunit